MGRFVVRAVRNAEDHKKAESLMRRVFCASDFRNKRTKKGSWWLVREASTGRAVAFCALSDFKKNKHVGYLYISGVDEHYRGNGLQRRMIRVRLRAARLAGYKRVVAETYNNPESANNLIACGFRMFKPKITWSAPGACYWTLTL